MSRLKASNEMQTYFVPKSVYNETMDEIQQKAESESKHYKKSKSLHCHQKIYSYFNTHETALCNANILEAAHQAFEDRNFRVLYEIIYKGLDKRDFYISKQLFEYLYAAIEIDPKIPNRNEMLVNAVKGFKALDNDEEAESFIKRAHLLIKVKRKHSSRDSDDIKSEPSSDEE